MKLNPYLTFNGDCREAFRFYEKTLGGAIEMMMTFGDAPAEYQTPPGETGRILHARLSAGDLVLMGSDAPPGLFSPSQGMMVALQVDSAGESERIFSAFSEGGSVQMPLQQTFWAERFGMTVDRFGTPWMVSCEGSQETKP